MKLFTHALFSVLIILSASVSAAENQTSLKIDKMDCPSCPFMIKKAIEKIDGVSSVSVSMETKIAVIRYDDDKASANDFIATTTELGYPSVEADEQ